MKKLLLLSTSAGAGHGRAAQALEETARMTHPELEVGHVDVLDFVGPAYRKTYADGYLAMVDRAPELWGHLYRASQRPRRPGLREKLIQSFDRVEFRRFRAFVRQEAPDVVLATHFLPAQVFAPHRRRGRDRFRFGLVLTDYDVHGFWIEPTVDLTFVPTEEVRARVESRGIPADRVRVTGIPVAPAFHGAAARRDGARGALGIRSGTPAVLVMGGGAGVGSLREAVEAVLASSPVHVLAVAGRNGPLATALRALPVPRGSRLDVFGFVNNIHELMAAADIAVTKSGGLTTAECLASSLAMVVREPIPGQEERNCDFVLEAGAGVKTHGVESLRYKVGALLRDPPRLARMRESARAAGRPDAAAAVLAGLLSPA